MAQCNFHPCKENRLDEAFAFGLELHITLISHTSSSSSRRLDFCH